MPRAKRPAPQRLDSSARQAQQWAMGPPPPDQATPSGSARAARPVRAAGSGLGILDLTGSDSDEEDEDYVPQGVTNTTEAVELSPGPTPAACITPPGRPGGAWSVQFGPTRTEGSGWWGSLGRYTFLVQPTSQVRQITGAGTIYVGTSSDEAGWLELDDGRRLALISMGENAQGLKVLGEVGVKRLSVSPQLTVRDFDAQSGELTLSLVVSDETLLKVSHPSDLMAKIPTGVRRLLDECLGLDHFETWDELEHMKHDIDLIYEEIKAFHSSDPTLKNSSVDPQHPSLLPRLRPYQRNAVKWMVGCEKGAPTGDHPLHPLYEEVRTLEGDALYYHVKGGFLIRDRPRAQPKPPGGILADEMGLGKTVEILSLMLSHPRQELPRPAYQAPIVLRSDEKKKKRRRRRSPTPVEFVLDGTPSEAPTCGSPRKTPDETLMQVDGNDSGSDASSRLNESEDHSDESDQESETDREEEYKPRPSRSRQKKVTFNFDEGIEATPAKKPRASKSQEPGSSILVKSKEAFDPKSVLKGRTVTAKSPMSDMILHGVIAIAKNGDGASTHALKKHLAKTFGKSSAQHLNQFKKTVVKLVGQGLLVNTSHQSGANGSFIVNPDHESFDSRGLYFAKDLSDIEKVIEQVITNRCYGGQSYNRDQADKLASVHKKPKKESSTYKRLKDIYEMQLAGLSEAVELTPEYRKARRKWNGTFFDTKVGQSDYFECICGTDLDADEDRLHRIQCSKCQLWQHSECVKFDVTDPYRGDYLCPHCWTLQDPVQSGATLIVSPSTISYQWIEEIQKHVRDKKVRMLFYEGTKQAGYIQPRDLASYDIVITSYTILQSETNYVDLPHSNSSEGRRFRNAKRYMAIPAPLLSIQWWRICLDEAQMIEVTTTKTAEMALRLSAVNRWCVTGTPIEKSLNDVQGLLLFLQYDPYSLQRWWRECLYLPFGHGLRKPLMQVLCEVLWRTAKKDVLDQINIPSQTQEIHWLSFSPIEEHFYRRQHIESSRDAVAKIGKCSDLSMHLSAMDRNSLNNLLNPLLRLRQSCCHPQAVRGQFIGLQKTTMTMENLLEQMTKKVTLECEDAHRQLIAALNGLAAIAIIEEQWVEASEKYREVLRTSEEYKDKIKTDTLQKLHTISNLRELLDAHHDGVDPTLRDDQLLDEAEVLKKNYLVKYSTAIEAAQGALHPITAQVLELQSSFVCRREPWYVQVINDLKSSSNEANLMDLVREEMAQFFDVVNDKEFKQIEHKYPNSRIVLYKLGESVAQLDTTREGVTKGLTNLRESPPETFLNGAVDCHLRVSAASQKNRKLCQLCLVHDEIEVYESMIFHFVKDEIRSLKGPARQTLTTDENKKLEDAGVFLLDDQRKGTWADCESERLLRAILKFTRQKSVSVSGAIQSDGAAHIKLFEAMKKEFKLMRILWRQIYDLVAGVDELNMSVMRLRLRFEDEPQTSQKLKLISDCTVAKCEFRKMFGQLVYLENLKNSDYGKKGGANPEPCPVCQQELGMQWSVLQCGHCYCVECIRVLIEKYSNSNIQSAHRRSLKCPICRNITVHGEISYVKTRKEEVNSEEEKQALEQVKGSLSTKMEAVVRAIMAIQAEDPNSKSLVFSTWTDVLDILGTALTENSIPFASLHSNVKFKRNLQKFKNRQDVKVLLLPITSGANGLNLIEASHVLLVEPILNPAQELQAIGRVHRIGQTKSTRIHRFIVRSTIEERMHRILSNFQETKVGQSSHCTEENVLTIQDLKNIFVD
ncbi:hypothetical protein TCAL_01692 [Tigriopus californicus]|uniref:E3 ubiquitin-protein ligase SHPRH n=1 Tax=Tigriopus californicus TaxID=6832 RepID=A0A553PL26_TIGCA|nr:hypothetical protein TCAL_01692 [Tigriopus californicus]|eukprot:TCALIF_01692-PA protein Name:"Similar to SHPRH E3 ubiquitin-protein ligase SHPRH (Homo sapiens)" AED:0.05 eAED:0.05 QI:192/0.88/0.9/1/0.88/0.9/10/113/1744